MMRSLDPDLWTWSARAETATEGEPPSAELIEQLDDLEDRLSIGDYPAVRLAAARLRRQHADNPAVLRVIGQACLNAEAPAEAVRDLEASLALDEAQPEAWFRLAQARDQLDQFESALQAIDQALVYEPANYELEALRQSAAAIRRENWREPIRRLSRLQADHPGNGVVAGCFADALLNHALRGWTEVTDEDDSGPSLASIALKLINHGPDDDLPPGWYPTTALQVKTAAFCLERLRQLQAVDPETQETIQALAADVAQGQRRHFHATWGEVGVAAICIMGGLIGAQDIPIMALIGPACGVPMIVGSFEPQYRSNRILLSRRKQTLGDVAIGFAQRSRHGAIAYNIFLMGTYPFVAAYKIYVNWGEGWAAKPEIARILASETPAAAARVEAPDALATAAPEPNRQIAAWANPAAAPAASADNPARNAAAGVLAWIGAWRARLQCHLQRLPKRQLATGAAVAGMVVAIALAAPLLLRKAPVDSPTQTGALAAAAVVETPGSAPIRTSELAEAAPASTSVSAPLAVSVSGAATVSNTAALVVDGATLILDGVVGEEGIAARQMESFIREQGGQVICERLASGLYQCRTSTGYDIAAAALANGAARASPSASQAYKAMQAQAAAEDRGIWRRGS